MKYYCRTEAPQALTDQPWWWCGGVCVVIPSVTRVVLRSSPQSRLMSTSHLKLPVRGPQLFGEKAAGVSHTAYTFRLKTLILFMTSISGKCILRENCNETWSWECNWSMCSFVNGLINFSYLCECGQHQFLDSSHAGLFVCLFLHRNI